jgi:hypothetical protein
MAQLWRDKLTGESNPLFILSDFSTQPLYQQNLLEEGDKYYIDEDYTLETIPPAVSDGIWIMTANGDAANTQASFITFRVDRIVNVFVAYDANSLVSIPTWLSSNFIDTGLKIETSNGELKLFSQTFTSGSNISLGGNHANGGSGISNYIVIVVEI